jgi:hypothetical protein
LKRANRDGVGDAFSIIPTREKAGYAGKVIAIDCAAILS